MLTVQVLKQTALIISAMELQNESSHGPNFIIPQFELHPGRINNEQFIYHSYFGLMCKTFFSIFTT